MFIYTNLTDLSSTVSQMTATFNYTRTKEEIYRQPASEAVARFVGIKNLFPGRFVGTEVVDCPALGGLIQVGPRPFTDGAQCLVGIRSEHVTLRMSAEPPRADEYVLVGRFEAVLDLGDIVLLLFRRDSGGDAVEIKIGTSTFRKLQLQPSEAGVISLPIGDLFLIPR